MQSPVYLLIWITAACAIWLIWSLGIRKLLLDVFRDRLFELRFELFRLAMDGDLSFDDPAYRSCEVLFCGLLRYGHRISTFTYLYSLIERERAKRQKDYVDVSLQITLRISRLQPATQLKLNNILAKASSATRLYMVFSSLPLFTTVMTIIILHRLGLIELGNSRDKISSPIEQEVYRAESRKQLRLAVA